MLAELLVVFYAMCAGFVGAGIIGSFYQLMTSRPPRFVVSMDSWGTGFISILVCIFAGPIIIMRNALRGHRIEHRPFGWLVASMVIAGSWSLCSGIVLLEFLLAATA